MYMSGRMEVTVRNALHNLWCGECNVDVLYIPYFRE